MKTTIITVIVAALSISACGGSSTGGHSDLRGMSCGQLTTEMLTMTGATATEPYDIERVRAINLQRDIEGCWE